jgi:hypothetical protein
METVLPLASAVQSSGIHHLDLVVTDVERSKRFYSELPESNPHMINRRGNALSPCASVRECRSTGQ